MVFLADWSILTCIICYWHFYILWFRLTASLQHLQVFSCKICFSFAIFHQLSRVSTQYLTKISEIKIKFISDEISLRRLILTLPQQMFVNFTIGSSKADDVLIVLLDLVSNLITPPSHRHVRIFFSQWALKKGTETRWGSIFPCFLWLGAAGRQYWANFSTGSARTGCRISCYSIVATWRVLGLRGKGYVWAKVELVELFERLISTFLRPFKDYFSNI